ncbi:MAG: hypothetical protein E7674_01165 [Ruminococcaceae bacterium]|nr:hypothetical protein [Oscillospiraceae bacterium]
MIKMLVGLKGSGKTKTLIDEVKKASEASTGSVVCVEYGRNLSYNIGYDVRLVDAKEYAVKDATTLYGFVCGLLASNHDVTDLFIDSALKICGEDIPAFAEFLDKFNAILGDNIHCMITASVEEAALPESAKKYIG